MSELSVKAHKLQAAATAFWQERTEQERRMLGVGGAVVGLALVYGLLIDPALEGRAKLRASLPLLRQEAAELQALARTAAELAARPPIQAPRMTNESMTASLAANGLKAQSLALTGEYAKLELKGAQFAALVAWLDAQRRGAGIVVQESAITGLAAPGTVDAALTLHQPAGGAR
ncbi:type II secretion system protein GspM [Pseudoduganella namucuonensis]|uniref:Type II secretion system protein M (GspM) n=1 Tax=Pseudoduganella namucuonensis TaxID=1035707 RepID=A0A1I7LKR2_9BURK|nr:type II secretion system protein M [Pseudoduganella namucuonensis]SFV10235.1 type II secretion system protein M (GspM) [Pseudoduganella namucuonensis]